jgi:MFS family permease
MNRPAGGAMLRCPTYKWWVVLMLWFVCFFNYADRQAISSVLPLLHKELGFGDVQLGLIGSAFAWVYAGGAPLAGLAADRYARKRLIIGACIAWSFFTLATAGCGGFGALVTVRALTGLGETFYFPAAMALLSDYHQRDTLSRALSWHQSAVYVGTILGSWMAALLAERFGWRLPFALFGPMGILLALVLSRGLREPERERREERGTLECTNLPPFPPPHAPDAPRFTLLRSGALGTGGPGRFDVRGTLRTLARTPAAWLLMGAFLCANFVAFIFLTWTPTFLVEKFHYSLGAAGLNGTLYLQTASALAVPVAGALADRLARHRTTGRMWVQTAGLLTGAAFVFLVGKVHGTGPLLWSMAGFGLCKGFYDSGIFASLYDVIEPGARGTAAGLMNTVGWGGAALGPVFVGLVSKHGGKASKLENLSDAISFGGIVYLLGAALLVMAMVLHQRDRRRPKAESRAPKEGRNPNSENCRNATCAERPSFGFRLSCSGSLRPACLGGAIGFGLLALSGPLNAAQVLDTLRPDLCSHYVERFNQMEGENRTNFVSNSHSWEWLRGNIPLFECPDREVEEIYYFRWWSFRKHVMQTTDGFVVTEFLTPVKHAGAFNTISCAVGHHLAEGRWLRDQRYLDDYTRFWLRGNGGKPQLHFHKYSSWIAAAVYDRYLVNGDRGFVTDLLDELVADYTAWERERRLTNGLFWQYDVADGMEESISGSRTEKNLRPTINSYMFGNARAIAAIARLAGRGALAQEYDQKALELKRLTEATLWNPEARFFEVRRADGGFSNVREELGFIPWYFGLPGTQHDVAWAQLMDPEGFRAAYGITTAERRHPGFRSHGCCKCEWDGAVWPFATSQTLTALGNILRERAQPFVSTKDYFAAFLDYARSQRYEAKPYIGEYLDETTGQWLKGKAERSRYYNHSTFADLLITGVVGLRARADEVLEVQPLLPEETWAWFRLDGVSYHGQTLTILWDRQGDRYGQAKGLSVLADGKLIAHADRLEKVTGKLP